MPGLTSAQLLTANSQGIGLPDGPTTPVEARAFSTWANVNHNQNHVPKTDAEMWAEFVSGPKAKLRGIRVDSSNYVMLAQNESSRLRALGFRQVDEPKIAAVIFESYRRAAGDTEGPGFLPVTEDSARLLTDSTKNFEFSYIVEGALEDGGKVVRKVGNKLEDLGEVIVNPITLPAVAIIGVVGLIFFLKTR